MNALRPDLPPLPARMRRLPISEAGYPVPWFVAWIDGKPEFHCIRPDGIVMARARRTCWLCGERLSALSAFVLGPMCAINRVNGEPPSHVDCARFAAKACPFLRRPAMERREDNMPEVYSEPAGFGIRRNPGCCGVWATRAWSTFDVENGFLFRIGEPEWVEWYAEGRTATRAEVEESIRTGLPILENAAKRDGHSAMAQLRAMHRRALVHLPPAEAST